MPQATDELRAKWGISEETAFDQLGANFYVEKGGVIRRFNKEREPTPADFCAIDFLCQEWDYGYEP